MRISDDRTGDALGVERQEQDCRALAKRRGWKVAKVYSENDTSAFTRRKVKLPDGSTALRVVRPAFRELLEDIASGKIDALVAYDLDRVARDPRDLEDLIDAVESRQVQTATVTGDTNLANGDGIFMARMLVNVANKSSRDTSRRVRRAMLSLAESGAVGGGSRPFGYEADRVTPNGREADAVRWAHEQIADGRSLRSIAADLAKDHPGRRWDNDAVRRLLLSPRNAGLRQHQGQVIGPASWPGLVTPEVRERTEEILSGRTHPSRVRGGPRRYLLTGLLVCGRCGLKLYPRRNAERQRFGCLATKEGGCGGSLVVYDPAEELVVEAVLGRLLAGVDLAGNAPDDPTGPLRAEIAQLEQQQLALGKQLGGDPGQLLMLQGLNQTMTERIAALRQRIAEARQAERVENPAEILAAWPEYDTDQRRSVIDVLVDHVTVGPAKNAGPRFSPARLNIVWR